MSSSVTLSAATRQNLLSLQDTAALTSTTQNRLSTGKKVSSALDNPVNFFTAQSLSSRSGDLGNLLDGISNGIQTIQAANQGLTSIQKLVDQAKSITSQALATQITTTGTASTDFAAPTGASTVTFYVNGEAKTAALASTDSIDTAIATLNTSAGSSIFSKDTTGKKIVLNATSDIEFKASTDQTALGFAAGAADSAGANYYGTGVDKGVKQSGDLAVTGVSTRASLAQQYNSLLTQIDQLAKDASYNGVNLLSSDATSNKLHISFNEKDTSSLDIQGVDVTSAGLSLAANTSTSATATAATATNRGNFLLDADIKATNNVLASATDSLRAKSSTFGSNLSVVQNRQDFSKNLINVLDTGAANLTDADLNEEAANSQALTTRQSLGISALSLANQAQQGILQLLR
ncbi:flagellar protein [Methylobacterium sp. C25]|uniref:flagellin N-terminal helical domain-containing protein n=1 Tax=Methylobacterium sp. C25 TaxID=2721622 RepID=UPI001F404C51|nr:flagellin [Methylobacterium sp. C25]MCE4223749.1 flagellar protein [Methylobacterium sp. C25]